MQAPYTPDPLDALVAAQSSVGAVLTALVVWRPIRPLVSTILLLVGVWVVVWLPVGPDLLRGLGAHLKFDHVAIALDFATAVTAVAMMLSGRPWLMATGLATAYAVFKIDHYVTDANWELEAMHLAWSGGLVGLHLRGASTRSVPRAPPAFDAGDFIDHDVLVFGLATLAAALVAVLVLGRRCDSADEWAYTYQAAIFWKRHAYAAQAPCGTALQNFWIFYQEGRQFSQYTPGWPLVMAPFVGLGVPWLAGPFSLGLLAVGVARVARRAAAGLAPVDTFNDVRRCEAAGVLSALVVTFGSTMLINGGSRFPHLFVAAMFAWSIEAVSRIGSDELDARGQWTWGLVLGAATSLGVAARPSDGGMLGLGVFFYFLYVLARRRVGGRAFLGTAITFSFIAGLTLVILRLQLGRWFKTGYSLSTDFHPWNKFTYSVPGPNEWKWAFPLATGAYCWWPSAPALGIAGLATVRRRGWPVLMMLLVGVLPLAAYYAMLEVGRGIDFGYGPRYQLTWVVPMAVGTGLLLAPLWCSARLKSMATSALSRGAPAGIALAALVVGVVRITPLVLPMNHDDVHMRNVVFDTAEQMGLRNAVVVVNKGSTVSDPLDLTQNLPLDLYPDQRIIYATERSPEQNACLRQRFPNRTFYRAAGRPEVTITPAADFGR